MTPGFEELARVIFRNHGLDPNKYDALIMDLWLMAGEVFVPDETEASTKGASNV